MRILPAILFLSLAAPIFGQQYYFENVSVMQGLPASKVYCVLQDSSGLVWLGTESGLASYDGNSITAFGPHDGMAPGGVRSLFLDAEQRLWCGHLGGGVSIGHGRRFRMLTLADGPIKGDVTSIVRDPQGAMWIGAFGDGARRIKEVPEDAPATVERFSEGKGPGEKITSIVHLRSGALVFLDAAQGLRQWDPTAGAFTPFPVKELADQQRATSLFEDGQGALWLGTQDHGALRWKDGRTTTYDQPEGMPGSFIYGFGEDAHGQVWVSTWGHGVVRIEKDGPRLFGISNGLHGRNVRAIARDREGNMLFATNDEGLDIFKGDRFLTFGEDDGLVEPHVRAVAVTPDGRIWFGTQGGVTVLRPGGTGAMNVATLSAQSGDLTDNNVRALLADPSGTVWIGTEDGGLLELGPDASHPVPHDEISALLGNNKVTALAPSSRGGLYVGTIGGLIHLMPGKVPTMLGMQEGLSGTDITALFTDAQGNTWAGTASSGISRIPAAGEERAVNVDVGAVISPTSFAQDKEGRIWTGTLSQGVIVIKDDKVDVRYGQDDGLLSNNVRSLASDAEGTVWVGTNLGLNRLRRTGTAKTGPGTNDRVFMSFTGRGGFTGIEALAGAAVRTDDGYLWFGTANGAVRVTTGHWLDQAEPPLIAVRVLKVNLLERDAIDGVDLSHTESDIRIEYGCVSLIDQGAVRYRYMLAGLQEDWQPVTSETSAHYPGLSPGRYVFKVCARNRAGIWSEPVLYHFTVLPPWYRSWWFYGACALAATITLFSYIKIRERQLTMRNLMLERKVEERTAEVVAQSKEIEGQKARIEGLLLNILPKSISDELNEKGRATARMHPEVTVMFTDMKGFTRVAEKMTPEELVRELDECFIQIDQIIGRYGIEKIKTIGDSYMCASGIPQADPWHAHKMILAAIEVREMMARWCRQREALGKEPWMLRIGIHTGPVVAGVVGQRKFAYDIWGDTVNTASRMESSGATGELNISGRTYEVVKDDFVCEYRGKVEAKNKGQIDMYFVRRIDPELSADANGVWAAPGYLRSLGLTGMTGTLG